MCLVFKHLEKLCTGLYFHLETWHYHWHCVDLIDLREKCGQLQKSLVYSTLK